MANPQKEKGYVPIANTIFEAFRSIRIPGEARQVLDCIIRQTYGYNKKEDRISLQQFSDWTGLEKPEVCRALAKLQIMKLIIGEKANSRKIATKYSLNKNYDEWVPLAKKPIIVGEKANNKKPKKEPKNEVANPEKEESKRDIDTSLAETPTKRLLAKKPPSKDNTKDNIQKTGELTPAKSARMFFKGVKDLMEKVESEEALSTRTFLQQLEQKYPEAKKGLIWTEIKKFYFYWTELNGTGTKERWEKQDAFQVDRRLLTWFMKIEQFKRSEINNKETKVGKL